MNIILAGFFGGWEIVLILAMALLLFGSKKLPELAKGLGQGIKEFKKATREVSDEMHNAMADNSVPPPQKTLPPAATVANSEATPRSGTPTPTEWNRSPESSSATPPQKA